MSAFISSFDLFKIGLGPSSSHTVGPMKAAVLFLEDLRSQPIWKDIHRVQASCYGSLALTGKGHGSDKALILGLEGEKPESVDPDRMDIRIDEIKKQGKIRLLNELEIPFAVDHDLVWHRNQNLPRHPNGMQFEVFDRSGKQLAERRIYSIGGGFIVPEESFDHGAAHDVEVPYRFRTGEDLLRLGRQHGLQFWQLVLANESVMRPEAEIRQGLMARWNVMNGAIERGFQRPGTLPGGMKVRRRAPDLYRELTSGKDSQKDPLRVLDWVNAFAIAVNEENAAFGRIVTAPTNGAAGIIPAVLRYYVDFIEGANDEGIQRFLLTATAVGVLYKLNASISGAEVGCQGEVGVASSMAAGALTEVLGGSNEQIENAAEIAMEHHLGMTCDPVGGLVQIPCIERNAMGAVKAINAARMSLKGDGQHAISLDRVIKTMWETGQDMSSKYKETSRGGLAVNWTEC